MEVLASYGFVIWFNMIHVCFVIKNIVELGVCLIILANNLEKKREEVAIMQVQQSYRNTYSVHIYIP
jgi:hypothetical protein